MKGFLFILLVLIVSLISCSILPGQDSRGTVLNREEIKKIVLYKGSYALLIGNSKYRYWDDLNSIPDEMKNLESILVNQHQFVVEKHDNLTSEQLKKTIDQFINRYGFEENNRLLIYFSGHGHIRKRRNSQIGYIVPTDAPALKGKEIEFAKNAIDMEQIVGWAKRIESKHVLFVFDSCFSGSIFRVKSSPAPPYITDSTMKRVRQFITSGEKEVPARSFFIDFFIEGIKGEADRNDDRYITGTELGEYVKEKVMNYRPGQTPQTGKIRDPELDQGDFVFILEEPGKLRSSDFEISISGIPAMVASSHVSPYVSVKTDNRHENLYLLPITEDVGKEDSDKEKYRISRGKRIVFEHPKNQYQFEWKNGIIYAGGEKIDRNGKEFKIYIFIVTKDTYERIQLISSMNRQQFDKISNGAIKTKKISFYRDKAI